MMRDKRRLQPHHPEILHIIPLNDTRDHMPFPECWCAPEEDAEHQGVFVHHSADGREDFEEGRRLPS